ncbi:hypothetical protein PR048_005830 [Dryococelus australis]|uniref:Uncharacterized protein n=1 Tax=Dryococelus australis TaxID=614101 RepID=A0ABQ9IA87_9NEOP|nr:hypothetical protein PR048_005830 [Dryococelus australis]
MEVPTLRQLTDKKFLTWEFSVMFLLYDEGVKWVLDDHKPQSEMNDKKSKAYNATEAKYCSVFTIHISVMCETCKQPDKCRTPWRKSSRGKVLFPRYSLKEASVLKIYIITSGTLHKIRWIDTRPRKYGSKVTSR